MPSKSKAKGNALELSVAKQLNEALNSTEFARTPGSGALMGLSNWNRNKGLADGVKNTLGSDLITPEYFKMSIECKNYNDKPNHSAVIQGNDSTLNGWIKETEFDSKNLELWPMLVFKTNRKGTFVVLRKDILSAVNLESYSMYKNKYIILSIEFFLHNIKAIVDYCIKTKCIHS